MIIECHDGLGKPVVLRVSRVLVCDDTGTPVAFCVEHQKGHYRHFRGSASDQFLVRAGDPDFADQLAAHGVGKTVVVSALDPTTMKPL